MIWIFLSITILCVTYLVNKLLFVCDHNWEEIGNGEWVNQRTQKAESIYTRYRCKLCKDVKETEIKTTK